MNWVLVIMMYSSGITSQQVGPYISQDDCLKALAIVESQDKKDDYIGLHGFCVPKPHNHKDDGVSWTQPMPKEFD
jgi:hypothetical protein